MLLSQGTSRICWVLLKPWDWQDAKPNEQADCQRAEGGEKRRVERVVQVDGRPDLLPLASMPAMTPKLIDTVGLETFATLAAGCLAAKNTTQAAESLPGRCRLNDVWSLRFHSGYHSGNELFRSLAGTHRGLRV